MWGESGERVRRAFTEMRPGYEHFRWPRICRRWAEGSIERDEEFGPTGTDGRVLIFSTYILVAVDRLAAAVGKTRCSAALRRLADLVEHERLADFSMNGAGDEAL